MPFAKGESGNPQGRPLGSKNRVAEDFVKAIAEDFAVHGVEVIQKVRAEKPDTYLKLVADLVPKDFNLEVSKVSYVVRLPMPCGSTEEWLSRYAPKEIIEGEIVERDAEPAHRLHSVNGGHT